MKIHIAGILPIFVLLSGVILILCLLNWFFPDQSIIHYILYTAGSIFMFFVIRFFRYPERNVDPDENIVYSGADGRVVAIEKVHIDEYFDDERIQVSVFMSILNVHINWIPIRGTLVFRRHHPGKHMVAFNPKSSLINEHTSMVVKDRNGREVMMRQIAGAVARRIICKPKEGQEVEQGEMIGMIKFGSRIDLLLPADSEVLVKIGEKVKGARTRMARLS
jgi:phosphatidylserine decarboxylase